MSERNIMKDPKVAEKMRQTSVINGVYDRHRERMTAENPMKNPEIAAKVSAAKKGSPSNRKGAILSDETKEKLRQAATGYKHTDEAKAKMSASRLGKKRGPYKKRSK